MKGRYQKIKQSTTQNGVVKPISPIERNFMKKSDSVNMNPTCAREISKEYVKKFQAEPERTLEDLKWFVDNEELEKEFFKYRVEFAKHFMPNIGKKKEPSFAELARKRIEEIQKAQSDVEGKSA